MVLELILRRKLTEVSFSLKTAFVTEIGLNGDQESNLDNLPEFV